MKRLCKLSSVMLQIVPPMSTDEFVWQNWETIKTAQQSFNGNKHGMVEDDDGVLTKNGAIWIPSGQLEIQLI